MSFHLQDSVHLLLGLREEDYRYERAIRLYQFQTWIYFPNPNRKAVNAAGRLAAARYLEEIQSRADQRARRARVGSTDALEMAIYDDDYDPIYREFIAPDGGWMH
jgi:hypothetical protein